MSRADDIFKSMCRDIIDNGTDTRGQKVRPHWEDGSSAYTIKQFGVVNRYDLSTEFPALTLRKTAIKSATNEMLWIWQKKSSNIHDLKSSIWDEWADESGSIGRAYGYQMRRKYRWNDISEEGLSAVYGPDFSCRHIACPDKDHEEIQSYIMNSPELRVEHVLYEESEGIYYMDQVDKALYDLKTNPFSRRIMTNIYCFDELPEMHLYPCAYSMTFNVTQDKTNGRLVLNGVLNQRSQDVLTANNWNVCQYAVLLHMFARDCGMEVGTLVHMIADAHIYDRHVPLIEELLSREPYPAPEFVLNPEKKSFYDFTEQDVELKNYKTGEQIKNIPVAV